jgi:hypothetical protein
MPGYVPMLQPVAHVLVQVREDLQGVRAGVPRRTLVAG